MRRESEPNTGCDEELRTVCVLATIGHGQQSRLVEVELEVLILELDAIDGLAPSTILHKSEEFTNSLTNLVNSQAWIMKELMARGPVDGVEDGSLVGEHLAAVAHALFASTKSTEVLRRLGSLRSETAQRDNTTSE